MENLAVEVTIRFKGGVLPVHPLMEKVEQFIFIRKPDKVVALLPLDWECFKNGLALDFAKSGIDSYWALAFFSLDGERAMDMDGNFLMPYVSEWEGVKAHKYVKRVLCVVKTPPTGMGGCVELVAFGIKLQAKVPAVKLFSMKFFHADGLDFSEDFIAEVKKLSRKFLEESRPVEG